MITVDGTGVTAASLDGWIERLQELMRGALGDDLSLEAQTPQGQLIGVLSLMLVELGEAFVALAATTSVDHAVGAQLDAIGSVLDVYRVEATRSMVTATVTGVGGTNLPQGSRAKTVPGGREFRTVSDVVLSAAGVPVEMEAVETGPVDAAAGSLTEIVTLVVGWETVTNPSIAALGGDRQADGSYRTTYLARTAHSSVGPLAALEAALEDALAGKTRRLENSTDAAVVVQEWTVPAHSILVVAEAGTDADVVRAVETHRGMGVGTLTAISGGVPDDSALAAVTSGTVNWDGTDYAGLDLSAAATGPLRAAALTTLLAAASPAPTISFVDGRYLALFLWSPDEAPTFGAGTVETAYGLSPAAASYPQGPFVRPRPRRLVFTVDVTRGAGFPSDGVERIRTAVLERVAAYGLGEQLWLNDLLTEVELVLGTQVTAITAQANSADVSGVATPADSLWELALGDVTVTVT